ncbi:MAG TPA: FHA domain-containing protein [Polyangia bacterium]|nr:FHA domain-containing protein [Polyangia bacterium]
MLADWGTTCGRCRPNLVAPKTLFMTPNQATTSSPAGHGMTLGWLVVVSSLDERHPGTLIELDQERSTLSRGDAAHPGQPGLVEFSDIYMSNGHAVVIRPRTSDRNDAFSIREREGAPTANGTFVNSRRILPGESLGLADGDVIKVGATQIVFRSLWLPGSDARAS